MSILFCVPYKELSTHHCPPFSLFVFHFRFRLFTFQPPLQRASLAKAVWKFFASLEKGGGLPKASRRDSVELYGIQIESKLLFNPSVCSRCSQPAPDGRESPLSLRDISPRRGESPFTREPFDISPHCGESPYLM